MSRTISPRPLALAACALAISFYSVVARAQGVDPAYDPGADQTVLAVAVQPDGKILLGGGFTHLGNGTATVLRNHIGRLNVDGTVDMSFNPGANSIVQAIAVQPDGQILIGGNFTSVGGGTGLTTPRNRIARLNPDGSVDPVLNPGTDNNVYALAVQPDGKILVGGAFTVMGGGSPQTPRIGLARLNPNGSPDSFNPGVSKTVGAPIVYTLALQPDGKIVVGGYFNGLGGGTGTASVRNYIGRLNADGSVDGGFDPGAASISGVNALAIQADGKIVVGGSFVALGASGATVIMGGTSRNNIGRLNTDGSVDLGFNPGVESQVLTLAVQADGKILAGGYFKWMGDAGLSLKSTRNYIGRMNIDGTVDSTFNPGADNIVTSLAIQPDGAIVATGSFLHVGGGTGLVTARKEIARFLPTDAAVQTLTVTGGGSSPSVETWMRSGAGPEVSRVTFEFSFDGTGPNPFYSMLGAGTRISGGWQLTSVNLPTTRTVWFRARGYSGSGYQNGSGSIVESTFVQMSTTMSQRVGDFDGDGRTDIAIYRPSTGSWWILQSGGTYAQTQWGLAGDIPTPGDYDGDGKADLAVYRPSSGVWFILKSSDSSVIVQPWGLNGDIPVPGDYDADGKTDFAVYRPSSGTWFVLKSRDNTFTAQSWGLSTDIPVAGDYDGDGKTDMAVYRPSSGTWFVLNSNSNYTTFTSTAWGLSTDMPVPGDYDGDNKTDLAVYRPSTGTWFILKSGDSTFTAQAWGISTDFPVPGDYDGDGKTDIAVYRPASGTWFVLKSGANYTTYEATSWGTSGDLPVLKR